MGCSPGMAHISNQSSYQGSLQNPSLIVSTNPQLLCHERCPIPISSPPERSAPTMCAQIPKPYKSWPPLSVKAHNNCQHGEGSHYSTSNKCCSAWLIDFLIVIWEKWHRIYERQDRKFSNKQLKTQKFSHFYVVMMSKQFQKLENCSPCVCSWCFAHTSVFHKTLPLILTYNANIFEDRCFPHLASLGVQV